MSTSQPASVSAIVNRLRGLVRVGFTHANHDHDAGHGGERSDGVDGGLDGDEVGDDPGDERADGEPAVTPEALDANGTGSPAGVGDVTDGGEQGGVDHRCADAE